MCSANSNCTNLFNVLLLGQPDVGKSAIIRRIDQDFFIHGQGTNSLGKDFVDKKVKCTSGETVSCRIWDTADMERYSFSLPSNLYRSKQGVIFVFSMTCKHSLRDLKQWIDNVKSFYPSDLPPCIIMANKTDDTAHCESSIKDALNMYKGFKCFGTSALDGTGITEALEHLADEMLNLDFGRARHDNYEISESVTVGRSFSAVEPSFNFVRIMKSCSIL